MKASLLALALLALLGGCDRQDQERRSRVAVKSLVKAPRKHAAAELAKVVALGSYALPDIEQEMHAARKTGRLRLIEALEQIGDPEALPLLDLLAQKETDEAVRAQAATAARALRTRARR